MLTQYKHVQTVPSSTWTINHNLGVMPAANILIEIDGVLQQVIAAVHYVDKNNCTIQFSSNRVGMVVLS